MSRAIVGLMVTVMLTLSLMGCVANVLPPSEGEGEGEGEEGEGEEGEGEGVEGEGEGTEGEGEEGEGEEGEGEGACQGDEPTNHDVAECDAIPTASCADTQAFASCRDAGLVLRTGLFDAAFECIADIPAASCDALGGPVTACFEALTACPHPAGDALCANAVDACVAVGDNGFTAETCVADLRSVNEQFLDLWLACFNAHPEIPCADVHEACYGDAFANLVN